MQHDQTHDDFAFDPIYGLPEKLPRGEHILWQGRPHWYQLCKETLLLHWVIGYFLLLAVWRVGVSSADYDFTTALGHAVPLLVACGVACAILMGVSWFQARSSVYTLTNRRVAMRMGAALHLTLNLPYTQIDTAGLLLNRNGTGSIALTLKGDTKFSYLVLWPHVRPWRLARPEPTLRAISDAAAVARLFADAAETRVSDPSTLRVSAQSALPAE